MAVRAMGLDAQAATLTRDDLAFTDRSTINTDVAGYVAVAVDQNVAGGSPDNTFRPTAVDLTGWRLVSVQQRKAETRRRVEVSIRARKRVVEAK